jgi:hypothetical protein
MDNLHILIYITISEEKGRVPSFYPGKLLLLSIKTKLKAIANLVAMN